MSRQLTIIKVRHGINGFKYSACDEQGYFIGNFEKLADVRKHWYYAIKQGRVILVRELDKMPDMSKLEDEIKTIDKILRLIAKDEQK